MLMSKVLKALLLALLFVMSVFSAVSYAGICWDGGSSGSSPWTADTGSYDDVNYCINSVASAEDTIYVPPGSFTWSNTMTITKGVNLVGAGASVTNITSSASGWLITYNPSDYSANHRFRLSGFTFDFNRHSGISLGVKKRQPFTIQTKVRVDNNRFMDASGQHIKHWGAMWGVVDNNIFEGSGYPLRANAAEGADGTPIGKSWWDNVQGIVYGSAHNTLWFEDNVIKDVSTTTSDMQYGGRASYRYNEITVENSMYPLFDIHGDLGEGTVYCAGFGGEMYGNKVFNGGYDIRFIDQRGGKELIFFNTTMGSGDLYLQLREEDRGSDNCGDQNPQSNDVEDTYVWVNRKSNTGSLNTYSGGLTQDKEYWAYTPSFDGTTGVGCGTSGNRPTTCTTGVGYWETDQDCTDLSDYVGVNPITPISGTLYKCMATNTWAAYYTPLAYPHPLRSNIISTDTVRPEPPQNLQITQ